MSLPEARLVAGGCGWHGRDGADSRQGRRRRQAAGGRRQAALAWWGIHGAVKPRVGYQPALPASVAGAGGIFNDSIGSTWDNAGPCARSQPIAVNHCKEA